MGGKGFVMKCYKEILKDVVPRWLYIVLLPLGNLLSRIANFEFMGFDFYMSG
jgi:hypothetical protein